jgi:hypothetical protein
MSRLMSRYNRKVTAGTMTKFVVTHNNPRASQAPSIHLPNAQKITHVALPAARAEVTVAVGIEQTVAQLEARQLLKGKRQ